MHEVALLKGTHPYYPGFAQIPLTPRLPDYMKRDLHYSLHYYRQPTWTLWYLTFILFFPTYRFSSVGVGTSVPCKKGLCSTAELDSQLSYLLLRWRTCVQTAWSEAFVLLMYLCMRACAAVVHMGQSEDNLRSLVPPPVSLVSQSWQQGFVPN